MCIKFTNSLNKTLEHALYDPQSKQRWKNSEAFLFFWYNDQRYVLFMIFKIEAYLVNVDEQYIYTLLKKN